MKIKNNSRKIVHIGVDMLMPGNEIITDAKAVDTPAIKILANQGILLIIEEGTVTLTKPAPIETPVTGTATDVADTTGGKKGGKKGSTETSNK